MTNKTIEINVPVLARVEGEGALDLTIKDKQIEALQLRIYEPPRYFEKFLEGRNYYDIPDAVARICGICPVAYQMSAEHALESIFETQTTPWIREMRRLIYCGEWLQSHNLHIHMLAAPDYLGFNSIIEMAQHYPEEVKRGLKLQTLGNNIISMLGGRSVHPVGTRTGGFFHAPGLEQTRDILQRLRDALPDAEALVKWTASLDLPDEQQEFVSVALRHENEYPLNEGRIVSDQGLDISISEYEQHFCEFQQPHSTALHALLNDKPYLVGPLARVNINQDKLPEAVRGLMKDTGVRFPSRNMFHSIIARAIEVHYIVLEAIRILENYSLPDSPYIEVKPKAGVGYGCTEAPRGLLWHRYELDDNGLVKHSRIVPPTSQNQARIEEDLRRSLEHLGLEKSETELRLHAEKVIRNYDPCISCSTHFLTLNIERGVSGVETGYEQNARDTSTRIKVIGIGSPYGGDQLGWKVIDTLIARYKEDRHAPEFIAPEFIALDRPGPALLEHFKDAEKVILVDALRNTSRPGKVMRLRGEEIINYTDPGLSSHGIGLGETLTLARTLNVLPSIILIGMELDDDIDEKEIIDIAESVCNELRN